MFIADYIIYCPKGPKKLLAQSKRLEIISF